MANTYTQIYLQLVFSPQGHDNIIPRKHKEELHKYITGIIQKRNHKLLAINCMPDHAHIFTGYNPAQALPDLLRDIKAISSKFINDSHWMPGSFRWQDGYGAFSYSRSQIDAVIKYINKQEEHHKKTTFREEYLKMLQKFEIEYEDKYLFEWITL
ncbi:MAG: IS200/IS605 family transposase [Ignavibacteriaceae bacterium]